MSVTDPEDAGSALAAVQRAQALVAEEIGLPRGYWWGMGAAWVGFGAVAELDDVWLTSGLTLAFGVAHATIASRLLAGRRRTARVQVSAAAAGRRTPLAVIAMLVALVAVTIAAALALDSDGAGHPALEAGVLVGALVACGGAEMLRGIRRLFRA